MGEFDHLVNLMTAGTLIHNNGRLFADPFGTPSLRLTPRQGW